MNKKTLIFGGLMALFMAIAPELALASVESTLQAVQSKVMNVLLPLAGILGVLYAAFSFFTGHPNARNHLILSIVGLFVGFGAPSIVSFFQGLIH